MALHIVLYQPLIPANTGNIARTCAATNTKLHLIRPLGFSTEDKQLKRAGLDYWDNVDIAYYESIDEFLEKKEGEFFYITKFAQHTYSDLLYGDISKDYYFIFGRETTGLPKELLEEHPERGLRLPMNDEHVRSLNLSNTAAIVIYEALRQQGFPNLDL
jgi:tRNA (cytidine/uridine-2'-O-)-methyltransferase